MVLFFKLIGISGAAARMLNEFAKSEIGLEKRRTSRKTPFKQLTTQLTRSTYCVYCQTQER